MNAQSLSGGFADAPRDAAHAFRAIMSAMARPGTILPLTAARPPEPLSAAAGTILLTLCDPDTPIWLAPGFDTPDLRAWIAFHTGAPISAPDTCHFALGTWEMLPLDDLPIGIPDYPDRSATVIVEGADLSGTGGSRLTGPGIETEAHLPLPDPAWLRTNAARFPLGLDFLFCAGDRIAALPRSTRIAEIA